MPPVQWPTLFWWWNFLANFCLLVARCFSWIRELMIRKKLLWCFMVFHSSFFSTFFYYFFAICMFLYTSNFFVWLRDKKSQRKILYQKVFRKTWSFFCHGNLWAPPPEGATAFLQILKGSWWLIPRLPWYYGRLTAWLGTWPNFTNTLEGLGSILEIEGPWPISRVFLVLLCVQQWGGIGGWKPAFVRDNSGSLDHVELERDWYPPES